MNPADGHYEDENGSADAAVEVEDEVFHLPLFKPNGPPPRLRADCLQGGTNEARPCGWITCRWYLPRVKPDAKFTCVLDVAEQGGATLEEVGELMGITRERVRQIEAAAFRKLDRHGRRNKLHEVADIDARRKEWVY